MTSHRDAVAKCQWLFDMLISEGPPMRVSDLVRDRDHETPARSGLPMTAPIDIAALRRLLAIIQPEAPHLLMWMYSGNPPAALTDALRGAVNALGSLLDELERMQAWEAIARERHATIKRLRPVYEAACAWRDISNRRGTRSEVDAADRLLAAVDAARKGTP